EPRVLSRSQAELFYAENRDKVEKKIFEGMVRYISNGEVVPIVLFGERDCWKKLKALIGHYRGEQLGTLRNKYGTERIDGMIYNRIHTPDSFENTLREMCIVFDSRELKKIFSPGAKELVDELTKESDISGQLAKETPARAEKIEKEQALNPLLSFLKRLWQGLKKQLSRKERGFALISPKETPEDEGARPAIIIAGTSGSGKTTFISKLMKEHPKIFIFPRLTTTRKPRHGEIPDKDRKFVDKKTFKKKIAQDQLIMVRERHGHWYGLDKKELTRCSKQGKVLIFDTTSPETISLIKERFPQAKLVLVLPFSFKKLEKLNDKEIGDILRERIQKRDKMTQKELDTRIQESGANVKEFQKIKRDAFIVNDSLEKLPRNYNAFKQIMHSLSAMEVLKAKEVERQIENLPDQLQIYYPTEIGEAGKPIWRPFDKSAPGATHYLMQLIRNKKIKAYKVTTDEKIHFIASEVDDEVTRILTESPDSINLPILYQLLMTPNSLWDSLRKVRKGDLEEARELISPTLFGQGFGYDLRASQSLFTESHNKVKADEAWLTPEMAYLIGKALGGVFGDLDRIRHIRRVRALVTSDHRISGAPIREALIEGLRSAGVDVDFTYELVPSGALNWYALESDEKYDIA
ncbi:hypothetical protein KAR91_51555, partial [Candidatus Pacearchaeota archaeon]|nr:hypothetical protein [Candidatus Pacearchaeota archaeon]